MSRSDGYRVLDEPLPGRLSQAAVDPVWPLFGFMFGGAWFAWPWFIVNGFALGSPTRGRETALALAGFVGAALLTVVVFWLVGVGILAKSAVPYALLAITAWKLGASYWLYALQSRSFDLYVYYGGPVRNGLMFVLVGVFAQRSVLDLSTSPLWKIMVG